MSTIQTYAYEAQTPEGHPLRGTLEAPDGQQARDMLTSAGLRVIDLTLSPAPRPAKPSPIRGDDLLIFNQHLTQLTASGMPVESSLRLIAQDMKRGRLARSIEALADDLEQGKPLAQAFETHRGQFPPLYAQLVDAGIRSNNLPGMLMNLGRHYEMVNRLRTTLLQALTYPTIVLVMLPMTCVFLLFLIFPQVEIALREMNVIIDGYRTGRSPVTQFMLHTASVSVWISLIVSVILLGLISLCLLAQTLPAGNWLTGTVLMRLPLIGPLLRHNAYARWCNALLLGIESGLPMPQATELAGQAVGFKSLAEDGQALTTQITLGESADPKLSSRRWFLPPSIRAMIAYAHDRQTLPQALESLTATHQQVALARLVMLQSILSPILTILVSLLILMCLLGITFTFRHILIWTL